MQSNIHALHQRVEAMQQQCAERDNGIDRVRLVRNGKIDELYPEMFADDLPKSVVGNLIDVACRDTAEMIAPLPALACAAGNMQNHSDEIRASKKNKIGSYLWEKSKLPVQNIDFADSILSYGFAAYLVEPNFDLMCPMIRYESPFGSYYYRDRWGCIVWYAKIQITDVGTLAGLYPEKAAQILRAPSGAVRSLHEYVRLVRYMDKDRTVVYLPDSNFVVLAAAKNPISRVPVVIAERPDQEMRPRGQYDDVVWPSLARSRMAQYMLKAADLAVNSPLVIPDDVTEINFGPDAIMRSREPQKIGKVRLDIPQDVFALSAELDRSAKEGARYPEARTGGIKGNIVTGRGVQELMGTMDTQVRTMQTIIGYALQEITSIAFEMDAALWPNTTKKITGILTGKPFELTYTPGKDIGSSTGCKVTYGFAAGLSPSQALVALLQLRGDDLVSRDTVRRQLPFDVDPEMEQRQVDTQQLEDAAKQGLAALLQAVGPMVMQGQDPLPILLGAAKAIQSRQKGMPIADAILEALTPPDKQPEAPGTEQAPVPEAEQQQQAGPPGQPGQQLPPGVRPNGLPQGVAYGQQGMPPGGMPDIQSLMSTLRGTGQARMEASTMVKRATA